MLEGEIGYRSNDQEVVLGAGGHSIRPRGEDEVAELASRCQLPFARPKWLPDVIARFN